MVKLVDHRESKSEGNGERPIAIPAAGWAQRQPRGHLTFVLPRVVLVIIACLVVTATVRLVHAQSTDVSVEVVPASIEIRASTPAQTLVVIRNPTAHTLYEVQLRTMPSSDVEVTIEGDSRLATLAAGGDHAWTVGVAQAPDGMLPVPIHFRVDYLLHDQTSATPPASPVARVAFAVLEVVSRPPILVEQVAQVEVRSSLQALYERQDGIVFLVITNTSNSPIRLLSINPRGPGFIHQTPEAIAQGTILAPKEVRTVPVTVHATAPLQPGRHLLVFEVPIEWDLAGRVQTSTIIASHEVEVGVLGESAILTVLAIPTFLLLPGCIMVLTVGFLAGLGKSAEDKKESQFRPTEPAFWLFAITLSLLAAAVYPWATARYFGTARDYRVAYGLSDVMLVWFASLAIGIAMGVVGWASNRYWPSLKRRILRAWTRLRDRREGIPTANDDPIPALEKLGRQKHTTVGDQVEVTVGESKTPAFLLQPRDGVRDNFWVAPSMVVKLKLPEGDPQLWSQLKTQLGDALDKDIAATELASLLRQGEEKVVWDVVWKKGGPIEQPYLATRTQIKFPVPRTLNQIIEREWA